MRRGRRWRPEAAQARRCTMQTEAKPSKQCETMRSCRAELFREAALRTQALEKQLAEAEELLRKEKDIEFSASLSVLR